MRTVAERFVLGGAAAAQGHRATLDGDLRTVGVEECDILPVNEVRSTCTHSDLCHSLVASLAHFLHRRQKVGVRFRLAHLVEEQLHRLHG